MSVTASVSRRSTDTEAGMAYRQVFGCFILKVSLQSKEMNLSFQLEVRDL